jgi:hypothetical protein
VPLPNSAIAIISKYLSSISLVATYMFLLVDVLFAFPLLKIEDGKIIAATPPGLRICFVRSIKKVSMLLLFA